MCMLLGVIVGALISGAIADPFGKVSAIGVVAAMTLVSGTLMAARMRETKI